MSKNFSDSNKPTLLPISDILSFKLSMFKVVKTYSLLPIKSLSFLSKAVTLVFTFSYSLFNLVKSVTRLAVELFVYKE